MSAPTIVIPSRTAQRRRELFFGTALGTAGVLMTMLTLVGAYIGAANAAGSDWLASNTIPLTQPNVMMFCLALSVVMIHWAVYAINNDDRTSTYVALAATLVLGAAFVNMTIFLWHQIGITADQPEGPYFYALTGAHVALVVVAMVSIVLVGFRALAGQYSSRNPDGIAAAALLWDAAVAVYAVIWVAVYIMK
ncbi:MAG: heme-copper oxidase subunit III [Microthrixaceae bacterium]